MGDVVDMARRRRLARPPGSGLVFSEELECLGTAGPTRVSIVHVPHDPGWIHVALTKGLCTPVFSVFPIQDTPYGRAVAHIVARVALRALRGASADLDASALEECTPEEDRFHEAVCKVEEARLAALSEERAGDA